MRQKPSPELAEHRGVEAGIGQLQRQGVLPVDAAAQRIKGLTVRESFGERRLPSVWLPLCALPQPLPQSPARPALAR